MHAGATNPREADREGVIVDRRGRAPLSAISFRKLGVKSRAQLARQIG